MTVKNKIIIFSDFDGTITKDDALDKIIIDLYSYEKYKDGENKLLSCEIKYEDYLFDTFENIYYDTSKISRSIVDEHFKKFYEWIKDNMIDFYVVSSGFKKIIIDLIPYINNELVFANDLIINDGKWQVKLYDNANNSSINKNNVIKEKSKPNYKTIFIGDGLSDFKVMGNVDYLFCKNNSLLHKKCISEKCDHIIFNNFNDILYYIENIIMK